MTTMRTKTTLIVCMLLLTPLFGAVFAQEPDAEDITEATATTATTSETTTTDESDDSWYRSERISGNIEVGDFVVGPGKTELELQPGQSVVREISVTNRISDDRIFKLEVEDIRGLSKGESALQIADGGRSPYSIKDYISFPKETFTLELGERARIPITITLPPDAEPGGFYGSVLVSTVRKSTGSGRAQSPLIARVGSLFFVTVDGEKLREGHTTDLTTLTDRWWYESGPIDFGVVYENTGSVHVNPYGELSVTNMFGEEVGYVELEPWFVLPQSIRTREVTWDREFLLGRYVATVKINRGYDDIIDEQTVVFWVLPWKMVGGIFLTLFITFFLLRLFFRTFEFKRK